MSTKKMNFNLQNFKIRTRLGLAFGLMLALMLALIVVALTRLNSIHASNTNMIDSDWVKADAANDVNATTRANARRNMELLLTTDKAQRGKIYAHIEVNKTRITSALETLERLVHTPEGKALLATVKTDRVAYVASFTEVGKLVENGQVDEAKAVMMEQTLPRLDKLQAGVTALADREKQRAKESAENIGREVEFGSKLLAGLGVAALLIAVAFASLIARSIIFPIDRAVNVANTVASGDLTSDIDAATTDETGQLLRALKAMNDSLSEVVSEVRTGTEMVSSASAQIAAGNQDLASRTEEQASSLEETAASMEEMTATVRQNAENAAQANRLAASASEVAVKGGTVMSDVVQTMDSINESSRKIADIIGVIDSIAFQTNILALNAAVEAARAGEQGRGFAVVASEVRVLAQRSAAAAKEIKCLIDTSVDKVETGCRLVEQAGSTMDEIVVSVRRVTDIMGEIAGASDEQTAGIGQINQAIIQMDQVTQQNAALVEESAGAAASLEDKAARLARTVAVFKLREPDQAKPHAPAITAMPQKRVASLPVAKPREAKPEYKRVANARPGSAEEWIEF